VYLIGYFNSRVGQLSDWFSADDFQLQKHNVRILLIQVLRPGP
jgi:hypothetical protein